MKSAGVWIPLLLLFFPGETFALSAKDVARFFAPIVYQDVDGNRGRHADLPLAADFDGNRRANDNWESLDRLRAGGGSGYDARVTVYYAVVETATHWFVTYGFFYPQDWSNHWFWPLRHWLTHENDFELAVFCIRKRTFRVEAGLTEAHGNWALHTDARFAGPGGKKVAGPIRRHFWRPRIFIEAEGHAVRGQGYLGQAGRDFPGGDGYVLRPGATGADSAGTGDPTRRGHRSLRYRLVPMRSTLWAWRFEVGPSQLYEKRMTYTGRVGAVSRPFGFNFVGNEGRDHAAKAAWGQKDKGMPGQPRGEIFFDPASVFRKVATFRRRFSLLYVRHPYLGIP